MGGLILVGGAGHSGTTMLDLMLGNRPDAFSCGEVYAAFRPFRTDHKPPQCVCRRKPCDVWQRIGPGSTRQSRFHAHARQALGVDWVVDSSKNLFWMAAANRWAAQRRLPTANVIIWKEPEELAFSHWKRDRIAKWHHEFTDYYGRFLRLAFPFVAVRHSDLSHDPAGTIRKVCRVVGMPYREGQERFWEKDHHHLFGSYTARVQVQEKTQTVRRPEVFPPGFEALLPDLQRQIAQDRTVQRIVGALRANDCATRAALPVAAGQAPAGKARLYPWWYYLNVGFRAYYRVRPVRKWYGGEKEIYRKYAQPPKT